MNKALDAVVGGCQAASILSLHTGLPLTVKADDVSNTLSRGPRADCVSPRIFPILFVGRTTTLAQTLSPAVLTARSFTWVAMADRKFYDLLRRRSPQQFVAFDYRTVATKISLRDSTDSYEP